MPLDQAEVDELLASMESAAAVTTPPSQQQHQHEAPPRTTSEVTDRKKTASTSRLTPRQNSDQSAPSASPRNTSSRALPLIRVSSTNTAPPIPAVELPLTLPLDLPSDVDALAASLQIEKLPPTPRRSASPQTHRESEASGDRASVTEASDKVALLPLLPASSPSCSSFSQLPHSAGSHRANMLQKQASLLFVQASSRPSEVDPILNSSQGSPRVLLSPRSASQLSKITNAPSRRRLTIGTHHISPHALERLGVNTDMLKKEKGMKKLGISDVDIERSEEIRRYSGVPLNFSPATKVEFMFGFTREQLQRVKAINRLGTSEEEVMDDYSRRVSRLGIHDAPIVQTIM